MIGGRPRKTQEELDAEMDDYWNSNTGGSAQPTTGGTTNSAAPVAQSNDAPAGDDIDMDI